MAKNPSWKTYRNRFKAHDRELQSLADSTKPKITPHTGEEIAGMWWISKTSRKMMLRDLNRQIKNQ